MPPLFVDTTLLVDRILSQNDPDRIGPVEDLLAKFDYLVTCGFSRLEVKRVVIQNLALVLDYICREHSFFRAHQKVAKLRQERRLATLTYILGFVGFEINKTFVLTEGDELDVQMALQAESIIRNAIRYIWRRFDSTVDSVVSGMNCVRAKEPPKVNHDGTMDVRIPRSMCRNRSCNNANFLRSKLPLVRQICAELERRIQAGIELTEEIEKIVKTFRSIERDLDKAYDYKTCLALGDLWIHLECQVAGVRHFGTRNYKESRILCPLLDLLIQEPAPIT